VKYRVTVSSSKMLPTRGDIRVEFAGKNLTKFGGIQLVRKFLRQLRVKEEIEGAVLIEKRESKVSVAEIFVHRRKVYQ